MPLTLVDKNKYLKNKTSGTSPWKQPPGFETLLMGPSQCECELKPTNCKAERYFPQIDMWLHIIDRWESKDFTESQGPQLQEFICLVFVG